MRSLGALALLGCVLLSACSGGTVTEAEGSCAALLDWNGVRYQGNGYRIPPELGERLGVGSYPGCDDGGGPASEQKVQVFAVEGVDPAVAVATEEADGVWLAPAYSGPGAVYPPALERVLLGPPCEAKVPFVVEGLFQGGAGRIFALEIDEADGTGRPYRGLLIELVVEEGAIVPHEPLEEFDGFERFRALVHCRAAARPNRTFVATEVSVIANGTFCSRNGTPCHLSQGPPHPAISGGSDEQRELLVEIVAGIGPSLLTEVTVEPANGGAGLAVETGGEGLRGVWEAWLLAGAFRDASHERGLPAVVSLELDGAGPTAIEGGPWQGQKAELRPLSRSILRAGDHSGAQPEEFGLLRPAGVVPAVTWHTNEPARFLSEHVPAYLRELGDLHGHEAFYFRVLDTRGEVVWEWAGSSRLGFETSGTAPGLEGCDPARDDEERDCRP
ncbi:MAG: DUF6281 family protein [Gaiellaceae bacterium]